MTKTSFQTFPETLFGNQLCCIFLDGTMLYDNILVTVKGVEKNDPDLRKEF